MSIMYAIIVDTLVSKHKIINGYLKGLGYGQLPKLKTAYIATCN